MPGATVAAIPQPSRRVASTMGRAGGLQQRFFSGVSTQAARAASRSRTMMARGLP